VDGLSIIGVALAVGVVVYALSLRDADETLTERPAPPAPGTPHHRRGRLRQQRAEPVVSGSELGFGSEAAMPESEPKPDGFVYVPILASSGTPWQTRLAGVIGILALVAVAAITMAFGVYSVGHALNGVIQRFLGH
jgi:hypothetical protein